VSSMYGPHRASQNQSERLRAFAAARGSSLCMYLRQSLFFCSFLFPFSFFVFSFLFSLLRMDCITILCVCVGVSGV
jgi:hypothetical protein